jgi:hypothetical protein
VDSAVQGFAAKGNIMDLPGGILQAGCLMSGETKRSSGLFG